MVANRHGVRYLPQQPLDGTIQLPIANDGLSKALDYPKEGEVSEGEALSARLLTQGCAKGKTSVREPQLHGRCCDMLRVCVVVKFVACGAKTVAAFASHAFFAKHILQAERWS